MTTLQPLGGSSAEHFAYWGERASWLVALSQHRDSDYIARSNWRLIAPAMVAAYPDDAAIESQSHWAVGWSEVLLVRPDTESARAAQEFADRIADYPMIDEDDASAVEWDDNHHDEGYCYADDSDCHATDNLGRIILGWRGAARRALIERYGSIEGTRTLAHASYHGRLWHRLTGRTSPENGAVTLGL